MASAGLPQVSFEELLVPRLIEKVQRVDPKWVVDASLLLAALTNRCLLGLEVERSGTKCTSDLGFPLRLLPLCVCGFLRNPKRIELREKSRYPCMVRIKKVIYGVVCLRI